MYGFTFLHNSKNILKYSLLISKPCSDKTHIQAYYNSQIRKKFRPWNCVLYTDTYLETNFEWQYIILKK